MKNDIDIENSMRRALARAYCTDRNKQKILDTDLIEDMIIEIKKCLERVYIYTDGL